MKNFYCEDCGVPEDLHLRAVNTIFDIETRTMRTETIYLCTKCKDEREEKNKDRLKFSQAVGEVMEKHNDESN